MTKSFSFVAAALLGAWAVLAADDSKPFVGNFALTIPGGGAGWLGIEQKADGTLKGSILWGGGSVLPVDGVKIEGDKLVVTRLHKSQKKDAAGKTIQAVTTETITATLAGEAMQLTTSRTRPDGKVEGKSDFTGKRIPPVPPAPDLAKVKFGEPLNLFNGRDLTGWKIMGQNNGWRAENGLLVNEAPQEPGKHKAYANIRTEREFEDFNLTLEFRVPKNGNSGIYLRGIYEIQVADSYGQKPDPHGVGGLYSRLCPTENAGKLPGEWQTFDITLVDRHVTVTLNGRKVIDNQPALGCTGGALWSDEFRPGPLYLQGDHTSVDYRNIVIRPVVK